MTIGMFLRIFGFNGLLCAIRAKFTRTTVFYKLDRKDCKYPFMLRIPSSDLPIFKQVFVNQEYNFLVEKQPKVIIDAGANIGLTSIYFANKYPGAKIIALEPEQSNYELLEQNVASYPNVTPIQAALWHKNEEINVVDLGLGKWGFMTKTKDSSEGLKGNICHTVSAMTVNKIITDFNLSKLIFLRLISKGRRERFLATLHLGFKRLML